ncbi:twin-arginine translocase subunit TatC [Sulfurovum sp. CS9]|uniref:twin-arginine translocase subunit TatC n=1 Tax=Sulfurovum sp. CS9 TaxID=3391146 RepID=UPI0039EB9728
MFSDLKPHLAELRKRLGLSVLSIFVMFVVAFIFHNGILTWVTQPLNDALTEVGLMIESKEKGTWHVDVPDSNASTTTPATQAKPKPAAQLSLEASRSADKLQAALTQASETSIKQQNAALGALLKEAATAAKETATSTKKLSQALQDLNLSKEIKSVNDNTFGGMITTHQVGGAFFVALKVSFFAAILAALPFILYQLWLFIAPGLYNNEKKMVIPFVIGGSVMFFIGVLFAYYVVTPFGFQFLITFGSFLYTPLINIEDYVGFFTKIMMGFGVAFELPVFAYFLALLGMVTDRTLIDFFKYAVIIIFVGAALLTPPDILTQLLMAAPLILLYGISILIVRAVNPAPKEDADEDEEDTQTA